MTSRFQQWWPSGRRAGVLVAALAVGALPASATAQAAPAAPASSLCRCFVGDDSTRAGSRDRHWALLGAAGLALLAGVPIGSAATPAIPFVEGPAGAPASPLAELAAAPPTAPGTLPAESAAPLVPGGGAASLAPISPPDVPPLALVPPLTATHLPLLAAAGVLLMAGGGLLARRQARHQRRRRRRLVAL